MDAPPAVELAWSQSPGAEGCIDRPALRGRVEQIVGRKVFAPRGQEESVIRGKIAPGPGGRGWIAVVEARTDGAMTLRRELASNSADCRQLDEALVLVVALMVDSSEKEAPLTLPAPALPPDVGIGPDFALAFGMLPGAAVGLGVTTDVQIPPLWPIALSAHGWPATDVSQDGSGGRLGAFTAGGSLCPLTFSHRDWATYGCAGITGGVVYSSGVRLDLARSNTRPYAQADLRIGVRIRVVGPLFAGLEVEGGAPFAHDSYTYEDAAGTVREVFRTADVVALGHLRLEVRVP